MADGGLKKPRRKKGFTHRERNLMQVNQYLRGMIRSLLERPKDPRVREYAASMLAAADADAAALQEEADADAKAA